MSEWKNLTIPEFSEIISGATPATNVKEYWDGEIEWVTPVDLSKLHSRFLNKTIRKISERGLKNSSATLIPANNIVMSSRAPIGYFAIPTKDFTTNQGCKSFKLNPQHNAEYHYYNFLYNIDYFKRFGSGSTFAEISKKDIEKLSFRIPASLSEQRKIARILSTVDAVIEKTEAAIAKYKAIKSGMMHDLFTRGIDLKTGKLRPSYEDAPSVYKPTELGWMPKEWDVVQINDIAVHVGSGITPTGGSNVYKNEGILFLRSQNIHFNGLHLEDVAYIENWMHNAMERSHVSPFDVLLNITGASIGRCCYYPDSLKEANVNQHVCIIRVSNPTEAKAVYISTFLSSSFGQNQIDRLNAGGNREGLNYQQLRAFFIPWPMQNVEIEKNANALNSISRIIETETKNYNKMLLLKQALMSDLLTGKVRVKYEEEKKEMV